MTRPAFYIVIFAAPTLTGCAQLEAPVAPRLEALASTGSAGPALKSRPWTGHCEGTAIFTDSITLHITAGCNFAHIGRARVVGIETVVPVADGFIVNAVNTYTATNGDKLYTRSRGLAILKPDFSGVTFSGTETAVGGTGRISTARGSATRIGRTRFSDSSGSYENVGTLTYTSSDSPL